jgi:sigma-B regulation protein RsbU (phosphoserine phosphatase)
MFSDSIYEEGMVQLNPDDLVVAYTDGVIEALSLCGREWGTEGLRKAAIATGAGSADDMAEAIMDSMHKFSLQRQIDDATLVVARVN